MKAILRGRAYVLGDNIDTDQIIPAEHLTLNPAIPDEYKQLGRYALSGVPKAEGGLPKGHIPFHDSVSERSPYSIIIAGKNFGCGSSREHAAIALNAAGVEAVVAEFYARIFFRNAVNGGYLIPFECDHRLCEEVRTGDELEIHTAEGVLWNRTTGDRWNLKPLGEIAPILEAGGLFAYARQTGMLRPQPASSPTGTG